MDALERGLSQPIPLEKAAAFFVGLKSWQQPSEEDDALMAECVKQASAASIGRAVKDKVVRGHQLLTGSKLKGLQAARDEAHQAAQAAAGKLMPGGRTQAALRAMKASDALHDEGHKVLKAQAAASGIGTLGTGAIVERQLRNKQDRAKTASLLAQFRKIAAEESTHGSGEMSAPAPAESPEEAYLANEQAGMAAEEAGSVQYYQQVMSQLREQLAAAQQQAEQATAHASELEAAQSAHMQEMQGAQQESQLAQQAAMQQVQSANMAATQSMQQAVDAENRALLAKGQEAAAKIQQQQVRSQLFDLASQGTLGSEPQVGPEGDATSGMATPPPAEQPPGLGGTAPAAPPGQPGVPAEGEQPTAAGGESPNAGMNEAGQPANAEGMPGQEASTEAAGAAAGPGTLQPPNDSSGGAGGGSGTGPQANGTGEAGSPKQDPTAKRTGGVSIKVGHAAALAFLEERRRRPLGSPSEKSAGVLKDYALKELRAAGASPEVAELKRKALHTAVGGGALIAAGSTLGGYAGAGHAVRKIDKQRREEARGHNA